MLSSVLTRLGFRTKADVPIINDGAGNRPTVRVSYGVFGSGGTYNWAWGDYASLAREGYGENSDVYSAVSLIAQTGKQVKWDTETGAQSIALMKAAAGSVPNFVEAWLSYMLLAGECFLEIERTFAKLPYAVHMISPHIVTAVADVDARYQGAVKMWSAKDARGYPYAIAPADMVQSKMFNPFDAIRGFAPLQAAILRVRAENQGAQLLSSVLGRGFSPGWIEAAENSIWEETQINALKERMRSSKMAGEELFLENAKWHQMGFSPADSGVAEAHVLSKRDIASVFHVDPALIGDTTGRTYATYRESRHALYMEAVIPLLTEMIEDWNTAIGNPLKSPLAFDKNSFDAIMDARAEATDRVMKLWAGGLITQDEARAELRYDPAAPGDVFYAPANFLPMADDRGPVKPPPGS